jgi:hypothetical protein
MSLQQFKRKLRPYLLKELDEAEVRLIESAYFADPGFLRQAEEAELSLIQDYLDRRLNGKATARFEKNYLANPGLAAKVAEIASKSVERHSPRPSFSWKRTAVAICLAALMVVLGVFELRTPTFYLHPGVSLGGSNNANEFSIGRMQSHFRLVLELPAQPSAPMTFGLRLWTRGQGGQKSVVWTSTIPLAAHQTQRGRELVVVLDSSLLSSGTYVVEVIGPSNESLRSFLFSVSTR